MLKSAAVQVHRLRGAAVALLLAVGSCAQLPPTSAVVVPPIRNGAARIWFYRDYEPYETLARPYVRLNGQVVGISEPGGAFYRDVAPDHYPDHYYVTVDTAGRDVNQFPEIDLAAGQQVYAKVLSLRSWLGDDCMTWGGCDTFYVWMIPADAARAAIASSPFYGGG